MRSVCFKEQSIVQFQSAFQLLNLCAKIEQLNIYPSFKKLSQSMSRFVLLATHTQLLRLQLGVFMFFLICFGDFFYLSIFRAYQVCRERCDYR